MNRTISASVVLAVAGLTAASCASQATTKEAKADQGEYEYVTPLGSNIPVRVKKGQTAATTSPTANVSADDAANMLHGSGGQMGQLTGKP